MALYFAKLVAQKKGEDLGPPFIRIALAFFQALGQSEEVQQLPEKASFRESITTWWNAMKTNPKASRPQRSSASLATSGP